MNKEQNMTSTMANLYQTVKAHRGPIMVEVQTMDRYFWVEVKKGDLLDQISRMGLGLVDLGMKVDHDTLHLSRKYLKSGG